MSEGALAARAGTRFALVYMLPLIAWFLGQAWLVVSGQATAPPAFQALLPALFLLQCGAVALCTPWLLRYHSARSQVYAQLGLLLVPLPLYVVGWAAGSMEAVGMLPLAGFLGLLVLGCHTCFSIIIALTPSGPWRGLAVLTMQSGLCLLLWSWRHEWLRLVGL